MEKKVYGKPLMYAEKFVPQNFVAACPPSETYVTYQFWCDAGNGSTYNVYIDNGDGTFNNNSDIHIGNFYACREAHSVTVPKGSSIDDIFPKGFIGRNEWTGPWEYQYVARPVRIWRGENNDNIHCTFQLSENEFTIVNPS